MQEQYCDATILCEGHFYRVHRFVLATCSSYFEQMFSRLECKHPMIVLADIKAVQLEALLIYMYNGELNISQKSLPDVLQAATSLKVRGLSEESDDEVDMEINSEVMTPHILKSSQRSSIAISGQLGRECTKITDFDSKCKAVKRKRQTDSSTALISNSSTRENSCEVIEICTDIVQPPTDFSLLSVVESITPYQRQTELSDTVSAGESENHHEALMLWNGGLDFSAQKDTDPTQNCNINHALSPSVEVRSYNFISN